MPEPITRNALGLFRIPQDSPEGWAAYETANWDTLSGFAALAALGVQPRDLDANLQSSSLYVIVYQGSYIKADGTVASYPGSAGFALAPNLTTCLWLTDAGVLTGGGAFPATAHVRLAVVTTDATKVITITDSRVMASVQGSNLGGNVFRVDTTAATVGFFGNVGATQAASLTTFTNNTTGTATDAIPDAGAAYNQATLNNIHSSIIIKMNSLIAAMKRHGLMSP